MFRERRRCPIEQTVPVLRVVYPDLRVPPEDAVRLRGFFAGGAGEGSALHNHGPNGREIYRYPLVQYKVVDGHPAILALGEGIGEIFPRVMERESLLLGGRRYDCGHTRIEWREETLGDCAGPRSYRVVTPWFGLNQANHRRYAGAALSERTALAEWVLTGNLLSLSKGLGVTVDRRLTVDAGGLREVRARFKGRNILCFAGGFSVNYRLPALLGLGKSVSRGFGSVVPAGDGQDTEREEE